MTVLFQVGDTPISMSDDALLVACILIAAWRLTTWWSRPSK